MTERTGRSTGHPITSLVVFEPDDRAVPTGLLDKDGNELCRVEEIKPVGFGLVRRR